MTDLPAPLTTHDIDLRNFPDMPLEVARLRDSGLRRKSSGDEFKAAILLWCAAWHQKPAGSLPNDDEELADLAFYGTGKLAVRAFLKVKAMAMRGWTLASDGRWYHPRLAAKALMAWKAKQLQRERTYKARLASLVKALEKEHDPARRGVLQAEHDKLLAEMSHALSQGTSQPPREGIGSEGKGSEGIGRDNSLSTSPSSPSAPGVTTTSGDDAGQELPPKTDTKPPNADAERPQGGTISTSAMSREPTPPPKPQGRKANAMDAVALRLAVNAGNLVGILTVFRVEDPSDPGWAREGDGLDFREIVAVLAWRRTDHRDPVRMPSGFRHAVAEWRSLKIETRRYLTVVRLSELGVEHGIVLPVGTA